ncbi:Fic family protein [Bacillus mexicanus]|uniref:Fic/DOC family protein n=1 Tax=Bacillus mexicanus TaxID=2834415 RepID=UPI003D1B9D25
MNSRYTYDNYKDILINKAHLTSQKELNEFETIHTYRRLSELALEEGVIGKFNIEHLKDLHKHIFQDVYLDKMEMAAANLKGKLSIRGEFRQENIAKGNFQFANARFVESALNYLLNVELKNDNYLKGLSLDEFIRKITYYLAELNVIHPFREGNGRTTREFIRQLSLSAGYNLDWGLLDNKKDDFMEAMIASVSNTLKLEEILSQIIQKSI